MIERTHDLPIVRQCEILRLSRSTGDCTLEPSLPSDLATASGTPLCRQPDAPPSAPTGRPASRQKASADANARVQLRSAILNNRSGGRDVITSEPPGPSGKSCLECANTSPETNDTKLPSFSKPETFDTDQGSQFTSSDFTDLLENKGIKISMDGKGCWRDNVFVERLWKSVKYEEVYLKACDTVAAAQDSLGTYLTFYNTRGPHQSLDGKTPDTFYSDNLPPMKIAACMTTALPTAPAAYGLKGPSATVTVDNAKPQGATFRCGNTVQTNGTIALGMITAGRQCGITPKESLTTIRLRYPLNRPTKGTP